MNPPPPVSTLRRGNRAYETYPAPTTGRHGAGDYPHHMNHAASVQFGDGLHHHRRIPEQLDPAVYGQYRRTGQSGQSAQYNPATLRRTSEDGKRRVSFEDDHVDAARRQAGHKTVQRPRSANITSQRERMYGSAANREQGSRSNWEGEPQRDPYARETSRQSGYRTVQRPRSATIASQNESVYSTTSSQQRMQWAGAAQDTARPSDQGGYSRAGYHLNQAPQKSALKSGKSPHAGSATPQGTAYAGDYRARSASHGAGYSTTSRQQSRASQNGYEHMSPVNYSQASGSNSQNAYGPAPEYPGHAARPQQRAPDAVNYGAQNFVQQQRTAYRPGHDQRSTAQQGYEEMAPLYLNPAVPYSGAGIQQNGTPYSAAGGRQNGTPYNTTTTQQNGIPHGAATSQQNEMPYGTPTSHQNGLPYSTAANQRNMSFRAATGQQNGLPFNTSTSQWNGIPYSTAASSQNNNPYSSAPNHQNGTPYSSTACPQNGSPYSTTANHQNRPPSIAAAIQQHCMSYSTAPSQQNGTSYSVAATHQNGAYTATHYSQGGSPQVYSEAPQENGYDGYDSSSDSEFDDTDDDQLDYVNLQKWHGGENGSNSSTNQDDR